MGANIKPENKRAWVLTKAMVDTIEGLPDDMKLILALKLFEYGMTGSHRPCSDELMAILRPMKNAIDVEQIRHYNKMFITRFQYAVRLCQKSAPKNSSDQKRYGICQSLLKQAYAEVKHHHVPNVSHYVAQLIGPDVHNELLSKAYFSEDEKNFYREHGIVVDKVTPTTKPPTPRTPNPERFSDFSNFGR